MATGRFVAPRTAEVTLADGTTGELRGANVIISTGTRASLEPIPGLAEAQPLTHIEAFELDEIPGPWLSAGLRWSGAFAGGARLRQQSDCG
jgi:pyruvate/2-oxoglutarate dehydrogenase complex dihydrolipoamide dehydrogenase (E3) component